jgi:hypothetical protein
MPTDDRRDFLKQGLVAAALAAIPLAAAGEPTQKVPLTRPIKVKVLDTKETTDGDRLESSALFDLQGENGAVHHVTGYSLKIERADSYDTTLILRTDKYAAAGDSNPLDSDLRVIIVTGEKGQVDGDTRTDEIQTTVFGPQGVMKSPPQTIKKSLVDPYAGMDVHEKAQAIINDRVRNPRGHEGSK